MKKIDWKTPEDALCQAELLAVVERLLAQLPPREALAVRLRDFEGQPLCDLAATLGIDKSWASRVHRRALARLAKRVRAEV